MTYTADRFSGRSAVFLSKNAFCGTENDENEMRITVCSRFQNLHGGKSIDKKRLNFNEAGI